MNKYDIAVRAVRDRRRADLDAGRLVWQTALADNDRLYAAFAAYQSEMIKNAKGEKNALAAARSKLKAEIAAAELDRSNRPAAVSSAAIRAFRAAGTASASYAPSYRRTEPTCRCR